MARDKIKSSDPAAGTAAAAAQARQSKQERQRLALVAWGRMARARRLLDSDPSLLPSLAPEPTPFCITFHKTVIAVPPQTLALARERHGQYARLECRLNVSLFNMDARCFFGNTWRSASIRPVAYLKPEKRKKRKGDEADLLSNQEFASGATEFVFSQSVYFSSRVADESCYAVAEVVLVAKNRQVVVGEYSLGWSLLSVFGNPSKLKDSIKDAKMYKVAIYDGTPRALFLVPEPVQNFVASLRRSTFEYTVYRHQHLRRVMHLFRENELLGLLDHVPGIKRVVPPKGFPIVAKDVLAVHKGMPMDSMTIRVGALALELSPELDQAFVRVVNDLRIDQYDVVPDSDDVNPVAIVARRLKVGVHNGLTFVRPPSTVDLADIGGGRYTFDGSIDALGVVPHPSFVLVFQLEYAVRMPIPSRTSSAPSSSARKAQADSGAKASTITERNFVIGWGPFLPYGPDDFNEGTHSLPLIGGPAKSLTDDFVFTPPAKAKIKVRFAINFPDVDAHRAAERAERQMDTATSPIPWARPDAVAEPDEGRDQEAPVLQLQPPKPDDWVYSQDGVHADDILRIGGPRVHPSVAQSRAIKAKLFKAGFGEIRDSFGNKPFEVGETVGHGPLGRPSYPPVDPSLELGDPLQANEVIFQFLAIESPTAVPAPKSVFFTLQFYNFPPVTTDRLIAQDNVPGEDGPLILRRYGSDGAPAETAGLRVPFIVDPAFSQGVDEIKYLVSYMRDRVMRINVWDGDSLLQIGTVHLRLNMLLRQQKPGVQLTQEFDILSEDYASGNLSPDKPEATAAVHPPPPGDDDPFLLPFVKGKLHLRIANIGRMASQGAAHESNIMAAPARKRRVTARPMAETDTELDAVLRKLTPKSVAEALEREADFDGDHDQDKENAAVIQRQKRKRIDAVKRGYEGADQQLTPEVRELKELQLKQVQHFREMRKPVAVMQMLKSAITTRHTIYPSFGTASFFEFPFQNPFEEDQVVEIKIDDRELRLVTDPEEWRYFKSIYGFKTPAEDRLFEDGNRIFLRPSERVYIPFVFQSYASGRILIHSHPTASDEPKLVPSMDGKDSLQPIRARPIAVDFVNVQGAQVALLEIQVQPRPFIIDQAFRFTNAENEFFRKGILLPPSEGSTGPSPQKTIRCSDSSVVASVTKMDGEDERQEVFVKVRCGPSPEASKFFLTIYNDRYCASLYEIWEVHVQSLQKLELNAVVGQKTTGSVVIRGGPVSRRVRVFTADSTELSVNPPEPFNMVVNALNEVFLVARPKLPIRKEVPVNVVDIDSHKLLSAWSIAINARMPLINKSFDLNIPRGEFVNKKILYTNPYQYERTFVLSCNMPEILRFKDEKLVLGPRQNKYIGLRFVATGRSGKSDVLVFINDEDDKNEETLCIHVNFT